MKGPSFYIKKWETSIELWSEMSYIDYFLVYLTMMFQLEMLYNVKWDWKMLVNGM
jgi:hypothetical protein